MPLPARQRGQRRTTQARLPMQGCGLGQILL